MPWHFGESETIWAELSCGVGAAQELLRRANLMRLNSVFPSSFAELLHVKLSAKNAWLWQHKSVDFCHDIKKKQAASVVTSLPLSTWCFSTSPICHPFWAKGKSSLVENFRKTQQQALKIKKEEIFPALCLCADKQDSCWMRLSIGER